MARLWCSGAVEGTTDEAVLRRLARDAEIEFNAVFGRKGKASLVSSLTGYNASARHRPWVVLIDLDRDWDCAPRLLQDILPAPAAQMRLRVAVREVEAWLLADSKGIAQFLRVARSRVPTDPDDLADPKAALITVASRSSSRAIREDIVPRPGSGRAVGPAYASRITEFVASRWRPEVAAASSESLAKARAALGRLADDLA